MIKHALVTGSNGFVGRHMVKKLEEVGYDVTQIDISYEEYKHSPTIHIDCRNFFALCRDYFDVVIHASAYIGGRTEIEENATFLGAYNLQLDSALFDWALRIKPAHIVCLSSSAVYPIELQEKSSDRMVSALREIDQSIFTPRYPDATYGWTKLTLERLAYEYTRETGRSCHVVRPFSGYGTDQGVDYPFGAFLERTLNRENPFKIWGDGSQVRDWIHIDDICNAIMIMINKDIPGPVNLCSGIPTPFAELAELFISKVSELSGRDYVPEIEYCGDKPTGVSIRYGDPSRMHEFYTPLVSIDEGVSRALRLWP
jgi:nucleoside-diphosphate-sugar epimerase